MGALALCPADLRAIDGEHCVMDVRLGEVLGMAQPLDIRRVIRKNEGELSLHGSIRAARELIEHGKGGRREVTTYYLSEAQALLICMFSRAPNAAAVRAQIITVYMAYRRGELTASAPTSEERAFDRLERRIDILERAAGTRALVESPQYAAAVTYTPAIFRYRNDAGDRRKMRFPDWWGDQPVRAAVLLRHRQMTIDQAIRELREEFGDRAPSRSSLGRFWRNYDKNWGIS
ncbi:hypothetical protein [Novosphingobium clariflavum]|uniref:Uncharacterized protein n=1 Tax=Novosphingobium clariflavum TaxID=2029884 RepID=A0ABV6SB07_9SPHN|nr:hypothetical protein [Novosphingobium clariflavum]